MSYCDKCGRMTPQAKLVPVQVLRQTYLSPAEFELRCPKCRPSEREREGADA